MALLGRKETRRLAISLFLGACLTVVFANVGGIFRGASITPLLVETVNLPGTLFASLCGSPLSGDRVGIWRALFYLGNLIAYSFIAYIALAIGGARTHSRYPPRRG